MDGVAASLVALGVEPTRRACKEAAEGDPASRGADDAVKRAVRTRA